MTMPDSEVNIYQLSGLDERDRGFTRQVECSCLENGYHVVLRYERIKVEEHSATNETSALQSLIKTLQTQGYTQLRSQLIFRGEAYLGSQELWVDYPDTESFEDQKLSVIKRFRQWLNRKKHQKSDN